MKIPDGMSEQETLNQIMCVIDRIAPRYTFSGYEIDDLKQEAFIICMDGLSRYDQSRPLENFLSVHLSNRLKNFVRDNYFVKNDEDKKRVMAPKQLSNDENIAQETMHIADIMDIKEAAEVIDRFLPHELRADYLKIVSDVYIPKKRKEYVLNYIKFILKENGYA